METVGQNPFVLCTWPSFADQSYINNYRVYDDRVGETTFFTFRPEHEWYWLPEQIPTEVSMLKCYDSLTDDSVSRWSFHTSSINPTAPDDAPCRKNFVVRAYIFSSLRLLLGAVVRAASSFGPQRPTDNPATLTHVPRVVLRGWLCARCSAFGMRDYAAHPKRATQTGTTSSTSRSIMICASRRTFSSVMARP